MTYDEILANASPRPWKHGYDGCGMSSVVHGPNGQVAQALRTFAHPEQARADAALITLAVNAHEALVDALDKMRLLVLMSPADFRYNDSVVHVLNKAESALALVKVGKP